MINIWPLLYIDETNSATPASMIEFLIQGGFLLYSLHIFLLTTMFSNIPDFRVRVLFKIMINMYIYGKIKSGIYLFFWVKTLLKFNLQHKIFNMKNNMI